LIEPLKPVVPPEISVTPEITVEIPNETDLIPVIRLTMILCLLLSAMIVLTIVIAFRNNRGFSKITADIGRFTQDSNSVHGKYLKGLEDVCEYLKTIQENKQLLINAEQNMLDEDQKHRNTAEISVISASIRESTDTLCDVAASISSGYNGAFHKLMGENEDLRYKNQLLENDNQELRDERFVWQYEEISNQKLGEMDWKRKFKEFGYEVLWIYCRDGSYLNSPDVSGAVAVLERDGAHYVVPSCNINWNNYEILDYWYELSEFVGRPFLAKPAHAVFNGARYELHGQKGKLTQDENKT
jgi:hypothetical protein